VLKCAERSLVFIGCGSIRPSGQPSVCTAQCDQAEHQPA
jgi:hypothetical protein